MPQITREQHLMLERLTGQQYCLNGKLRKSPRTLKQSLKLGLGSEYVNQHVAYLENSKSNYNTNTSFGRMFINIIDQQITEARKILDEA